MRTCTLVSLLLAACAAPLQRTESAPEKPAVLPSHRCREFFLVEARIDGRGPYTLILDTGASQTLLDPRIHQRRIGRLELGPLVVRDVSAAPLGMHALSLALGERVDGILGYPVFQDVLLVVDYPNGRVLAGRGALPAADGREVFDLVGHGRPYLNLEFGKKRMTALFDTGASGGIGLATLAGRTWAVEPVPVAAALTAHGFRIRRGGRLATDVRFGPVVFERPVVRDTDGISMVGTSILRRFRLTFDQRSRRVRFEPGGVQRIQSPPVRGAGFALRPRGSFLEVMAVFPDGPAARAGLRAGDRITHVDGRPVATIACERLGEDKERLSIRVQREGQSRVLKIAIELLVP